MSLAKQKYFSGKDGSALPPRKMSCMPMLTRELALMMPHMYVLPSLLLGLWCTVGFYWLFLYEELITYYNSCCCCSYSCCGNLFKAPLFQIRLGWNLAAWQECYSTKYASIVWLRLSISCHTFKIAAMPSFNTDKCCHLVSAYTYSVSSSWSIVHSYLFTYYMDRADCLII